MRICTNYGTRVGTMNTGDWLNIDVDKNLAIVYFYCIYRNEGDMIYVGQVSKKVKNKLKSRHSAHLCGKQYVDKMLKTHRYDLGVLWIGYESDVDSMECYFINLFETMHPFGLNLQTGGHKNKQFSEEVLKKMSQKRKGQGAGKKHSEETKHKMSESARGRVASVETREKLKSRKNLNKPVIQYSGNSGKFIKKYRSIKEASRATSIGSIHISQVCRGLAFQAGGFVWRFESHVEDCCDIEVVKSKCAKRKICQKTLDGDVVAIYDSLNDACRKNNYSTGQISDCCNGKNKTAKGFRWEYID